MGFFGGYQQDGANNPDVYITQCYIARVIKSHHAKPLGEFKLKGKAREVSLNALIPA